MTTAPARQPMTSFQKTVIALLAALTAAVVIAVIVFLVVARSQAIEDKKAECEAAYSPTSPTYWLCIDRADD